MSCVCFLNFVGEEIVDHRDEIIQLMGGRARTLKWFYKLDFIASSVSIHLLILLIKLLRNCLPVGSSSRFQSRQFWPAGGCLAKNYIFSPMPTWVGPCDKCSSVEYEQKCYVSEADMPFPLCPHPLACVGVFDVLGRRMISMAELLSLGP